jgi:hypothetical protein
MKIKAEYLGKTLTKSDSVLGKVVVKVDESCIEKRAHLVAMGFDFIFEKERVKPEIQEEILRSEPEIIDQVYTDSPQIDLTEFDLSKNDNSKPKKTRKKKTNANSEQ